MSIYTSVSELIGKTPLLELKGIEEELSLKAKILAKLEYFNPTGSVKDRIAKAMIEDAEKSGKLTKNGVIIEPTSGNTGIGIAAIGVSKGYKVIIVMPDTMSMERRTLIKAYGAQIVLTDGKTGMKGAIQKANELKEELKGVILGQFSNPVNPRIHYDTTAREIYDDTQGKVDIFVAGVGTGGTLSGVGRFLKEKDKNIKIYAVEPKDSPVLSKGESGAHKIQGIGAGFIPDVLDTSVYDGVLTVTNEDAFNFAKIVRERDGVSVGISSGASLKAAIELAKKQENEGKTIVVIFPDSGDRYLSTRLFQE